jgi:uncharacterized protein (TIGR04255 family)
VRANLSGRSTSSVGSSGPASVLPRADSREPLCWPCGTHLERFLMFSLDPAPRYRLARPPLVQAVGQVRFAARAKLANMDGIAPVQEHLDAVFPYMRVQQVQQVALLVGPAGAATTGAPAAQTWHFDDGKGWAADISPDTATLTVGPQYGEFSEFTDRFEAVLRALSDAAGVTLADRLGIRYLNVAELPPGDGAAWRRWFRPELTGWPATDLVGDSTELITTITQTQLSSPPTGELAGPEADVMAIVRHGLVPANTIVPGVLPVQPRGPAYLLDIDIFTQGSQRFVPEELSRQLTALHGQIDRLFYWALTDEGAAYFGREVLQ